MRLEDHLGQSGMIITALLWVDISYEVWVEKHPDHQLLVGKALYWTPLAID